MKLNLHNWIKIALLNLFFVAAIGIILRYKILYPFPFIDQKHLLHGHSHFAFTGWISQALMALLIHQLGRYSGRDEFINYRWYLTANLLTAYGMLIAFQLQGYGIYSIAFSTLSIFVSYAFAIRFWKALNRQLQNPVSFLWYKAALIFQAVSSLGAFSLAYMMANKIAHQEWYLGSVYFFLHFQYNGWFFFAGMGLLYSYLEDHIPDSRSLLKIFWLFAAACIPAYFLSALWLSIPVWVFVSVVIAAFLQVIGWGWLVFLILKRHRIITSQWPVVSKYILILSSLALTVKLYLQLGSTIPSLSQFAFGFRPIVIGYLHLVLLGVFTLFLLGFIFSLNIFHFKKNTIAGCLIFTAGIILNEIGLMTQGIAALSYNSIPYINEYLLGMAVVMFTGIGLVLFSLKSQPEKNA